MRSAAVRRCRRNLPVPLTPQAWFRWTPWVERWSRMPSACNCKSFSEPGSHWNVYTVRKDASMKGIQSYIRQLFFVVSVTLITCVGGHPALHQEALAEEITIAAASDLNFAIKDLIAEYEKATGNHVRLSLGSSGNFFAQIQNGAPFDLYFSADIGYPKKLEEAGLIMPGSLYRYAVGRIVIWTPHESRINVAQGIDSLREPQIKKIAIANPKHAPYGRAAVSAMKHFSLYDHVKEKL